MNNKQVGCMTTDVLLRRLYNERECRGTGLAGRLLDEARSECRRRGAVKLRLTVFEKNARAIAFYRQSRFAVKGLTAFHVAHDVQRDIEMAIPVDAAERGHNTGPGGQGG
ncbi:MULTISPECIES: GNAT family N-acetyltransferase [unclassified Sinorhizobium]|uniref:GNAT family N-acetyltransferase n=1 Tax=unclassified Sinorhizobium TaxID=2613772 RepID=UPI0035262C99